MKKYARLFSLFFVVALALMLAACGSKTEAPTITDAQATTTVKPQTKAPTTTTTKAATQAPATTTKVPGTTTTIPATTTTIPTTTTNAQSITYTVTLEEVLPEGRTILIWAWDSYGSTGYTPEMNGTTLTFTTLSAIDGAIVVVLKEGETELGQDWANKDYQSPDLTFTDGSASWNNHIEDENINYTITLAYEIEERTILVYAWSDAVAGQVLTPTINGTTLTFTAKVEFTKSLVVVLKEGETELGQDWANKDYQSPDLTFVDHACSYANEAPLPKITYTINCDTEINRTVYVLLWDGQQSTPQYNAKATVNGKVITVTGYREYNQAIIRVLFEGDDEVNSTWTNIDYESPLINLTEHEGTYNNAEVSSIKYTITLNGTLPENRTILVWGWGNGPDAAFSTVVEGNTLTFETTRELSGCLIVVLNEGETELKGDWSNKEKQTYDLTLTNHTSTWDGTWK